MHAASHGSARDVEAVPTDRVHTTEGCLGCGARRHRGAPWNRDSYTHRHAAPGQGGLGPRRR
uniref:Uncharacterized protein n=1 Tax=Arundo donax TaxID=35708 RepID=A0A0A9BLY1_ARUDO